MQALIATMTAKDPHRKQRMAAWAQAASNALRDQWPWHEDKEGDSSNG